MLSSLNAYNGLSAAELLKLFGANSSSSSSASSSSASTAQTASSNVSVSSASDPVNAIKAILAQAQFEHAQLAQAQTAASQSGSASSTAVASAYAAQTDSSTSFMGASANNTAEAMGVLSELTQAQTKEFQIEASKEGLPETPAEGGDVASLIIGTASDAVSMSAGTADQVVTSDMASQAIGAYQYQSSLAQLDQADSQVLAVANDTRSSSLEGTNDSTGNTQAEQPVLRLSIEVSGLFGGDPQDIDAKVEAQAQQLISAFEKSPPQSTSANGTGFSYAESDGFQDINITGIESTVGGGLQEGIDVGTMISTTDNSSITLQGSSTSVFQDLVSGSMGYSYHYSNDADGQGDFSFIIPLSSS